jgi:spermidine/putrescine transport system substrate-binding protein
MIPLKYMKNILIGAIIVIAALIGYGMYSRSGGEKELTVLSWDNYIGPNTIADFEAKYGSKVVYEIIKSNEEALARVKANPGVYDVVVVSDYMVKIMNDEGLLAPLDKRAIPNSTNVSQAFHGSYFDPSLEKSMPYAYGTTGFGVNKKHYTDSTISWKQLADPKYKGQIAVMDDMRYVLGSVLLELGFNPNTTNQAEIDQAVALLKTVAPNIQKFTSDTPVDLMVSEGAWIAYGYSGDIFQMNAENKDIAYMAPSYGTLKFLDNMVVMNDAPHKDMAHKYIDFILDPKVSADITNEISYGNPNEAAKSMISPEILNNPAVFPSQELISKLHYIEDVGDKVSLYDAAWEKVKQ